MESTLKPDDFIRARAASSCKSPLVKLELTEKNAEV